MSAQRAEAFRSLPDKLAGAVELLTYAACWLVCLSLTLSPFLVTATVTTYVAVRAAVMVRSGRRLLAADRFAIPPSLAVMLLSAFVHCAVGDWAWRSGPFLLAVGLFALAFALGNLLASLAAVASSAVFHGMAMLFRGRS